MVATILSGDQCGVLGEWGKGGHVAVYCGRFCHSRSRDQRCLCAQARLEASSSVDDLQMHYSIVALPVIFRGEALGERVISSVLEGFPCALACIRVHHRHYRQRNQPQ